MALAACGLCTLWHGDFVLAADTAEPAIATIDLAQALLEPAGLPARTEQVTLPHRWDRAFHGRDGHAIYRLELPAYAAQEPAGLLFSRVGNQVVLRINGQVITRYGEIGNPRFDAAKNSWTVALPGGLLRPGLPTSLEIEVSAQASRWGGLSLVQFGPESAIRPHYERQRLWRHTIPVILLAGFVLMSLAALGLWYRQHDALYGWFAAAAALGVVRHLDRVWPDIPLPWPLLGALVASCYGLHLILIFRVALQMIEPAQRWPTRLMHGTAVVTVSLAFAAFLLHEPTLWTIGLFAIVPYGVLVGGRILRAAWQRHSTMARVLAAAVALGFAGAAQDLLLVRAGMLSGGNFSLMPYLTFFVAIIMAGLIVHRHNRLALDYRALNEELHQRVAAREQQLREAFAALELRNREQAVHDERQRMMREIHDGVGSQLVGLLNLPPQDRMRPDVFEEQVKLALDEMRMAVDSLQPVGGDLATVLATLRYRLQPRLEAASIEVDWQVVPLPPADDLTPHMVLQVQRILMEAFTNVLKHSRASRIEVTTRYRAGPPAQVEIVIDDNGVGLRRERHPGGTLGHGLRNMHSRALALGAQVSIDDGPEGGTRVLLRIPTHAQENGSP